MATRGSIWVERNRRAPFSQPPGPTRADVAVIGGGIVGVTTAHLLRSRGLDVVLIEARRVAEQVTGGSSAKVTSQHGLRYQTLSDTFSPDLARRYGEANQWAIDDIQARIRDLAIDCSFERAYAYTYTLDRERLDDLRAEAEIAAGLGLPATFVHDVPLPFPVAAAVRFDRQAQFDPVPYTFGVAEALQRQGGRLFEGVRATGLDERDDAVHIETTAGAVVARDVVIATNLPFVDDGRYFAYALPRAHAVLAGRVAAPVQGMFISVDSPTRSMRTTVRDGQHWLVLVGEAFTPGDADVEQHLADLEAFGQEHFAMQPAEYRWWNEDYYSVDHLPYVGPLTSDSRHVYVATGFGGWGIANGNVAAHILADAITARANHWAEVYDSTRASAATDASGLARAGRLIRDNLATARNLMTRLIPRPEDDFDQIGPGEGRVVEDDGDRIAVARDDDGTLRAVSAICTHLGCELAWNGAMRSWDCGCHGSSFGLDGAVLRGPAVAPLHQRPDVASRRPSSGAA